MSTSFLQDGLNRAAFPIVQAILEPRTASSLAATGQEAALVFNHQAGNHLRHGVDAERDSRRRCVSMPAAQVVEPDFVHEFVRASRISTMALGWLHFMRWRPSGVNEFRFACAATDYDGFVVCATANLSTASFKAKTHRQRDSRGSCAGCGSRRSSCGLRCRTDPAWLS
jgi:hypothetical protein